MAHLSYPTLARIVDHLSERLRGHRVQKVRALGIGDFLFECFGDGARTRFRVQVKPGGYRFHLVEEASPSSAELRPGRPESLLMCMRKHLVPSRVEAIEIAPQDRKVTLHLVTKDTSFTLILKAYSNRPNLFLLNAEGRVLDLAYGSPDELPKEGAPPPVVSNERDDDPFANLSGVELHRAVAGQQDDSMDQKKEVTTWATYRRPLSRQLKRSRRRLQKLNKDLEKAGDPDRLRAEAQVLGTALHQVKRGAEEVALPNPGIEGLPDPAVIPLDPALSPQKNMDLKFRRARRAQRTAKHVGEERGRLEAELTRLEALLKRVDDRDESVRSELERPTAKPQRRGPAKNVKKDELSRLAHVHWLDDETRILVGRSSKANDALLRKYAKGNDLWFHVRDGSGSHVFLRPGKQEASPEALRFAAGLAAKYSSLKTEAQVDVIWTECKHVRKRKGAPVGQVQVASTRVVRVAPA